MVLDNVGKSVFKDSPLVLLDGVPIFDEDEIMNFSPLQVRKLEVMARRWYLGQLSFNGIVSYTTYFGDLGGFPLHPKSITLKKITPPTINIKPNNNAATNSQSAFLPCSGEPK